MAFSARASVVYFQNRSWSIQATLVKLANQMVSPFDAPKDSPDGGGGIPALYTYLGSLSITISPSTPPAVFKNTRIPPPPKTSALRP